MSGMQDIQKTMGLVKGALPNGLEAEKSKPPAVASPLVLDAMNPAKKKKPGIAAGIVGGTGTTLGGY